MLTKLLSLRTFIFLSPFGGVSSTPPPVTNTKVPTDIQDAVKLISSAERIVVMTGAGASAESGIPTYRQAPNSYWEGITGKIGMALFGTPIGWKIVPGYAWNIYLNKFLVNIVNAKPNNAHIAIANLEKLHPQVTVITTNVDGLHQAAGNKNVHELHGTVHQNKCLKSSHVIPADVQQQYQSQTQPNCTTCQSPLRPNVVLFLEPLHNDAYLSSYNAVQSLKSGDAFVVVGTSLKVVPAADLPYMALSRGANVIEVNEERCMHRRSIGDGRDQFDTVNTDGVLFIKGRAGDVLPKIVDLVTQYVTRRQQSVGKKK